MMGSSKEIGYFGVGAWNYLRNNISKKKKKSHAKIRRRNDEGQRKKKKKLKYIF